MNKKHLFVLSIFVLLLMFVIIYTQFTIFVIQPIGAVPEGKTLIISRLNKTNFVDSADAMCERVQGGVSLFCRVTMLGAVMEKATIYMHLPYSELLYHISTGGKQYEK